MPENKMILLIEGQRPIFGEKLRFFKTQPFKSAEAFSQSNIPQVPEVEYLPPKAVPATTPEYAKGGDPSVEMASPPLAKEEKPADRVAPIEHAIEEQDRPGNVNAEAPAKRTVNKKALRPKAKATAVKTDAEAPANLVAMEARIKAIEEGLKPRAVQLKATVETKVGKLADRSPTTRRNFLDIFNATVPDPIDVGVVAD